MNEQSEEATVTGNDMIDKGSVGYRVKIQKWGRE